MAWIKTRPRGDGSTAYLVVYKIDGHQGGLTFDTEKTAQAFKAAVEAHGARRALEMHKVDPEPRRRTKGGLTLPQWIRRHIDDLTGVEQYTIDTYERYLRMDIKPFFGDVPLTALTPEDIGRWVKHMETTNTEKTGRPLSPKSIKNKHGFLSGALAAAVAKNLIPGNPAAGRRLPRVTGDRDEEDDVDKDIRMLSHDEFAALLAATTEYWRPFVEFLVASGCRWGEATALRPADVDAEHGTVRIRRAWKHSSKGYTIGVPKTARSRRTVNVPDALLAKLDYDHEWLFVNRAGGPIRYQGFRRRVWDKAVARSKVDPPPTPHALRHTCGSWMLNAGVPIMTVSRHLGHESIKVTADIYGHVDRTSHRAAADVMGKLLG